MKEYQYKIIIAYIVTTRKKGYLATVKTEVNMQNNRSNLYISCH